MKLVYVLAGLALATTAIDADAKPKKPAKSTKVAKSAKQATKKIAARSSVEPGSTLGGRSAAKRMTAVTRKGKPQGRKLSKKKKRTAYIGPAPGQSVGAPWYGRLQDPSQLPEGERYVIRRPSRSFGTKPAVDLTKQVIDQILEDFPDAHPLAIGDMSAEHGGQITQHRSHQSGRDIDIGLFYQSKPSSYPSDFVSANIDNIDPATTFALLDTFADTASEDGGVQVMFLDYKVQGILYEWAKEHEVEQEHLDHLFQYPHGLGSGTGIVRHEPNHDNHIHVRFKCPSEDTGCEY